MEVSREILDFFADFIKQQSGIVYKETNYHMLEGRLKELRKRLGFTDVNALYRQAKIKMSGEMQLLITDLATNNETRFFRDATAFEGIREEILKERDYYQARQSPIRFWSAASSFGQEVYTLAILLEEMKAQLPPQQYSIYATDLSDTALAGAQQGTYSQLQVQRGLPTKLLIKYFDKVSRSETDFTWQVKPFLKQHVKFEKRNLLHLGQGAGQYDFILCRNVLIYQEQSKKEEIIDNLYNYLRPGGFLVMGTAESLLGMNHRYSVVSAPTYTFFRKEETRTVPLAAGIEG